MKTGSRILLLVLLALAGQPPALVGKAAAQGGSPTPARIDSAMVARRLSSRNPVERRAAAEELARVAAVEHRRLVEGYRVQEKDPRVRLAMDWALYRLGKNESLFSLVQALESKKLGSQSVSYLRGLESPEPLYVFLNRVNGNTQVRLLEVLAHVGDQETLERIKPFTRSFDPNIVDAARFAEEQISLRLAQAPTVKPMRQRQVGGGQDQDEDPR